MKVSEILADFNSTSSPDSTLMEELAQIISTQCKPFLSLIDYDPGQYIIWRGMGGNLTQTRPVSASIQSVRKDRIPSMTNKIVHKYADEYFHRQFNIRGRSQTMFATGAFDQAKTYGNVYATLPIGEVKFIWSPYVADMAGVFVGRPTNTILELEETNPQEAYEYVAEMLEGHSYKDQNLKAAIKSGNEIMVACDQYISISAPVFIKMRRSGVLNDLDL